ncbi:MAG: hypothetical protein IPH45_03820 [Bacteroidales bacterium]|nr:hypothetical protein [Bacteroidales bacterium]
MLQKREPWITVIFFALAMGLLETVVVIYLRELYYPEGFVFPVKAMASHIISTELLRELATLVMLLTVGIIAGKNGTTRFAWFIYAFAIWDIFYYIFLKWLVDWPDSLMTWDILFLIPLTWVGPVLGPVLNSLMMILLAVLLIMANKTRIFNLALVEWSLLVAGSVMVIIAYVRGYTVYMMEKFSFAELFDGSKMDELVKHASLFIPVHFYWGIFVIGVVLHLLAIGLVIRRFK